MVLGRAATEDATDLEIRREFGDAARDCLEAWADIAAWAEATGSSFSIVLQLIINHRWPLQLRRLVPTIMGSGGKPLGGKP